MNWEELREEILKRDRYTCQGCGKRSKNRKELQIHHIVSTYAGGEDIPSNLITLCTSCHLKITWRGFRIRNLTKNFDRTKGEGLELLNGNKAQEWSWLR